MKDKEIEKIVLFSGNDEFFRANMSENFCEIGGVVTNYPEFKKMANHNLLQVSEFEQNLCCGSESEEATPSTFYNGHLKFYSSPVSVITLL